MMSLLEEARKLEGLKHPRIVRLYEYIPGRNERAANAYRRAIDWGEDDPAVRRALEDLAPAARRGLFGNTS